jgi:hypothetical protein
MCHIISKWQDKEQEVSCGVYLWLYPLTINKGLLLLLFSSSSSSLGRSFWSFSSGYNSNDDDNIRIMMMMKQNKKEIFFFSFFSVLIFRKRIPIHREKKIRNKINLLFLLFLWEFYRDKLWYIGSGMNVYKYALITRPFFFSHSVQC